MEVILPSFAKKLKPLRLKKGMTQKDMAQLLGCIERHYQKIEYGQINISATMLITLADCFGVTTDYLLGRGEALAPLRGELSPAQAGD